MQKHTYSHKLKLMISTQDFISETKVKLRGLASHCTHSYQNVTWESQSISEQVDKLTPQQQCSRVHIIVNIQTELTNSLLVHFGFFVFVYCYCLLLLYGHATIPEASYSPTKLFLLEKEKKRTT